MLPLDPFTLITGLASLFGFAIQIFDLFPRLGRARQVVFLILIGVFIGSTIRAIEPASIRFNVQVTGFTAFIGLFILVVVGFLIAGASTTDPKRRGELFGIAGVGFLGLMFTAFLGSLMFGAIDSPAIANQKLTIHELSVLSDEALRQKDYERAVMHLKSVETRLHSDEARKKLIGEKIRAIELEAVK